MKAIDSRTDADSRKTNLAKQLHLTMKALNDASHFTEMAKINYTFMDQINTRMNPVSTIIDCFQQAYTHMAKSTFADS